MNFSKIVRIVVLGMKNVSLKTRRPLYEELVAECLDDGWMTADTEVRGLDPLLDEILEEAYDKRNLRWR